MKQEERRAYDLKYRAEHKEHIKEICATYYQNNIDTFKKNAKIYYDENKEKLLSLKKEKITCECSKSVTRGHKSRHNESNFHKDFLKKKKRLEENTNVIIK